MVSPQKYRDRLVSGSQDPKVTKYTLAEKDAIAASRTAEKSGAVDAYEKAAFKRKVAARLADELGLANEAARHRRYSDEHEQSANAAIHASRQLAGQYQIDPKAKRVGETPVTVKFHAREYAKELVQELLKEGMLGQGVSAKWTQPSW